MSLRITCTSSSYDDDQSFVVDDTRPVRRAVDLRREHCEAFGDGGVDLEKTGSIPDTSEEAFVAWVIDDIGDGWYDAEAFAYIYETDPPGDAP